MFEPTRRTYSLHADRLIDVNDRDGLERLARYGARSPIANSRLSLDSSGRVVLSLKAFLRDVPARIELVMEVRLGHVHPGHASRAAARSSTRS